MGLNSSKVQVSTNEIGDVGGDEWYNNDDNGDIMDNYGDDNYNNDEFQPNNSTPIPQKRYYSNTPKSALKDPAAIRNDKFKHALTLMDPHEVTVGSRQVRKAKTFRIPIIKNNSNNILIDKNNKMNSIDVYSKLITGNIPLTGLAHIHFNYIVKLKKKEARMQNLKLIRNNKNKQNIVDEVFLYKEVREGDEIVDEENNNYGDDNDDDLGGFWDNGDDGDYGDNNDNQIIDNNNNNVEEEGINNVINSALSISMLDEENLAKRVELALNAGFEGTVYLIIYLFIYNTNITFYVSI